MTLVITVLTLWLIRHKITYYLFCMVFQLSRILDNACYSVYYAKLSISTDEFSTREKITRVLNDIWSLRRVLVCLWNVSSFVQRAPSLSIWVLGRVCRVITIFTIYQLIVPMTCVMGGFLFARHVTVEVCVLLWFWFIYTCFFFTSF